MCSWVELDTERVPLVRWALSATRPGTGPWPIFFALREKGLTTRPGPSTPVREVSVNTLHKVLRNPYYLGVVSYQGATYEGKHEALIDTEIWLRGGRSQSRSRSLRQSSPACARPQAGRASPAATSR
ncbi:MAG: recombinase family protein [Acidobacteria bacterium]|nr:recombinase family protein [Acidobacteriota bacterium]